MIRWLPTNVLYMNCRQNQRLGLSSVSLLRRVARRLASRKPDETGCSTPPITTTRSPIPATRSICRLLFSALIVLVTSGTKVSAQGSSFPPSNTPISPGLPYGSRAPVDIPQTNLQPMGSPFAGAPGGSPAPTAPPSLGAQFDPYASSGSASLPSYPAPSYPSSPVPLGSTLGPVQAPGALLPPSRPGGESLFSRIFSQSASGPILPGGTASYGGSLAAPTLPPANYGATAPGASAYGPPVYGPAPNYGGPATIPGPAYPGSIYPSTGPSTLFPGGIFGSNGDFFGNGSEFSAYRLLQGPRLRHTYLGSTSDPDSLEINDTDVSLVFAWQNFLYSSQPLMIAPAFSLHQWNGPENTPTQNADLPSKAYSAFLDVGWQSDPNQILGLELGARVGVFSDFDTANSDSLRVLGKGLLNFRLTPAATLKGGVYVLDRIRYNVIPAGGILWQPNPYTRFDIFFPQPKLARYWRTVGTQDVWGYLGGEYGGGSWTVTRDNKDEQLIDINDYRVMLGLEWGQHEYIRAGRRNAFVEVGYVFDREILYENKNNRFTQDDAIMFRAGIGY